MSFVPEWSSHCIHKIKSTVLAEGVIALARSDTHGQLTPDYTICDFQSGTNFVFSLHNTRMKSRTGARISFGLKTGKWLVGEQNFVSVSWKQMERNALRWNELVPEWKSFRYHVFSPLKRGTCMASRSVPFHAYTYVAFLWHVDGRNLPQFFYHFRMHSSSP